jgi:hypothetical protein
VLLLEVQQQVQVRLQQRCAQAPLQQLLQLVQALLPLLRVPPLLQQLASLPLLLLQLWALWALLVLSLLWRLGLARGPRTARANLAHLLAHLVSIAVHQLPQRLWQISTALLSAVRLRSLAAGARCLALRCAAGQALTTACVTEGFPAGAAACWTVRAFMLAAAVQQMRLLAAAAAQQGTCSSHQQQQQDLWFMAWTAQPLSVLLAQQSRCLQL